MMDFAIKLNCKTALTPALSRSIGRGCKKRRKFGFTLVEVLVTMMLMAVVLPALMRGATIALSAASSARHKTEAASLAEAKLNELIALGTWNSGGTGDFSPEHPDYRWTSAVPATRDYGVSDVSLTVMWTEAGVERRFVVTTLMYDTSQTASSTSSTSTGGTVKGLPQ